MRDSCARGWQGPTQAMIQQYTFEEDNQAFRGDASVGTMAEEYRNALERAADARWDGTPEEQFQALWDIVEESLFQARRWTPTGIDLDVDRVLFFPDGSLVLDASVSDADVEIEDLTIYTPESKLSRLARGYAKRRKSRKATEKFWKDFEEVAQETDGTSPIVRQ